jgi:aldehyde dehydrogenase (NAD+)
LQKVILNRTLEIEEALTLDLGKAPFESYLTEIGLVLTEIRTFLKSMNRWAHPKRVSTPITLFPAACHVVPEPFGVTLIMSPWNYPFQLAINPLVASLAAGNTAVVKPASYAPATSEIIAKIIKECFPPEYVTTVLGGRLENTALLDQHFDFIFFTGSTSVGRSVLEKAAQNITPVCLELGGKSPCIVDKDVDLKLAAKRIAFGKLINAGQSCVSPDYLLLRKEDQEEFIRHYKGAVEEFLGTDPIHNPNYPHIINAKHRDRLVGLMEGETCVFGGTYEDLKISPTLLTGITLASKIMKEEVFGPILPILNYQTMDEVIQIVRTLEKPLALYLFTKDINVRSQILGNLSFGGATINDTMMHFACSELGFGGVGASGMGRYHGYEGFRTFSNMKGIVDRGNGIDVPLRYHPYTDSKTKLLKKILK